MSRPRPMTKKILILDNEDQEYEKYKKILMDNKYEVSVAQRSPEY